MSEGLEGRTVSERQFWADRMHWVIDALVSSGIAGIDEGEYRENRNKLVNQGWPEPVAAEVAFAVGGARFPSACEVNPW